MQHFFDSMQTCNRNENKTLRMENKTAVQENQSFSCKMRYCPLAFPDELRARDLPCDAKLPQAAHVFSHEVHMLPDAGKR